jgi:hypothetical protein
MSAAVNSYQKTTFEHYHGHLLPSIGNSTSSVGNEIVKLTINVYHIYEREISCDNLNNISFEAMLQLSAQLKTEIKLFSKRTYPDDSIEQKMGRAYAIASAKQKRKIIKAALNSMLFVNKKFGQFENQDTSTTTKSKARISFEHYYNQILPSITITTKKNENDLDSVVIGINHIYRAALNWNAIKNSLRDLNFDRLINLSAELKAEAKTFSSLALSLTKQDGKINEFMGYTYAKAFCKDQSRLIDAIIKRKIASKIEP